MPEKHFATLREYADGTSRQPDFDTIRRRAGQVRRRRRHTASSVVAGVTAVVVAAVALATGPDDGGRTDVPLGGRLWIPGIDPVTRKPAIASSPDGGRTWSTHVFADGVADRVVTGADPPVAGKYLPSVAAGPGATAYALLFSADDRLAPYRTTDGGKTWAPVPGGVLPDVPDAGFVTADGAHVVKSGDDFRASRNGGRYGPVTLAGYPAELRRLTQDTSQEATGRYVVTSGEIACVSDDGWTWRRATPPR